MLLLQKLLLFYFVPTARAKGKQKWKAFLKRGSCQYSSWQYDEHLHVRDVVLLRRCRYLLRIRLVICWEMKFTWGSQKVCGNVMCVLRWRENGNKRRRPKRSREIADKPWDLWKVGVTSVQVFNIARAYFKKWFNVVPTQQRCFISWIFFFFSLICGSMKFDTEQNL